MKFILSLILMSATSWGNSYHHPHRPYINSESCHWITGADLKQKLPAIGSFLQKLTVLDWYWAAELSAEMEDLSYCESSYSSHWLSFRRGRQIFLDVIKLQTLPATEQIQVLSQELVKSYLQPSLQTSYQAQRFSESLSKVMQGTLQSTHDLHLQMKENNIQFSRAVLQLQSHRRALEFLLADSQSRLMELKTEGAFLEMKVALKSVPTDKIQPSHKTLITHVLQPTYSIKNLILQTCSSPHFNLLQWQTLFNNGLSKPTLIANCLHALKSQPNIEVESELVQTLDVLNQQPQIYWTELFRIIGHYTINVEDGTIVVKGGITELSAQTSTETQILKYLEPLDEQRRSEKAFVSFIDSALLRLAKMQQGQQKLKILIASQEFRWAFNTKSTEEWIGLQKISQKEKALAITNLKLLYQYFWDRLLYSLWTTGETELVNTLRQLLNQQDLGYQI